MPRSEEKSLLNTHWKHNLITLYLMESCIAHSGKPVHKIDYSLQSASEVARSASVGEWYSITDQACLKKVSLFRQPDRISGTFRQVNLQNPDPESLFLKRCYG